jgi:hypothetical protein
MLTTKAQRRKRAAERAVFDSELHARIAREKEVPSDEQRRRALYQSCIDESIAEQNAAREKELAPVREIEKTLNADRERAARNARYDLSLPNCAYLAEICPPFSGYTGEESGYLDAVRNTFVNEFQPYLENTGVTLTQSGLESLAALSDRNTSRNWADITTFEKTWEHLVVVGYAREGRDFTVTEQAKTEPAPKPTNPSEDFETLLKTRAADDPVLRNAAHEFAIAEAQPTFQAWTESLMNSFGYAMSLPIAKQVYDWFIRTNHSFLDRAAYDKCRRAFVREGLMPRTCLTQEDLDAEEMDTLEIRTPEGRRRAAQLHREGIRRAEASQIQSFQSPSQDDF